jgi:hypothetical protein
MPIFSKPTRYHCFLTHDWGKFKTKKGGELVSNHDRVSRIHKRLTQSGMHAWFDEVHMKGVIQKQMCKGIDDSDVIVVFLTKRYIEKVGGDEQKDNCQKEFLYADNTKGGQRMIGVVMDPECGPATSWRGPVQLTLGSQLYVDFSDSRIWLAGNEAEFDAKISELFKRIETIIVDNGGSVIAHDSASVSAPIPVPAPVSSKDSTRPPSAPSAAKTSSKALSPVSSSAVEKLKREIFSIRLRQL